MKQLTTGKIVALCMGDFSRGMINGIITTYLLTFFIPTNANTTLPQFFLNAALIMAIIRGIGTVVDAITDPWVAGLTDSCKSPLGRRIPFLRWSAVPYGLYRWCYSHPLQLYNLLGAVQPTPLYLYCLYCLYY